MYQVNYKNIPVFKIETEKSGYGKVEIINNKYLPFDIYVEESDDIDDRVNNIVNFFAWCSGRILPLDREYAKDILNYYGFSQRLTDKERAQIGITTRCLSLNDCFWVKNDKENISWEDVNLFKNSLNNAIFEMSLFGKTLTVTNTEIISPDVFTDGKAPKAWERSGDNFYLYKGEKNDSVTKETEASKILTDLGIQNVGYELSYFDNKPASKCKCFTNEEVNLVRAEWFDIWCQNHDMSIQDYIYKYKDQFDKMILADYIVGNNDEHAQNWGFIYNNNMDIISMSPLMDYDHAFEAGENSICQPMRFLGYNITQKAAAMQIIKDHPEYISKDIDLSDYKYKDYIADRLNCLYEVQEKTHTCDDISLSEEDIDIER